MIVDPILIAVILLGGALLTFARRYNNSDRNAGTGVAGATLAAVLFYVYVCAMLSAVEHDDKTKSKVETVQADSTKKVDINKNKH